MMRTKESARLYNVRVKYTTSRRKTVVKTSKEEDSTNGEEDTNNDGGGGENDGKGDVVGAVLMKESDPVELVYQIP